MAAAVGKCNRPKFHSMPRNTDLNDTLCVVGGEAKKPISFALAKVVQFEAEPGHQHARAGRYLRSTERARGPTILQTSSPGWTA